MNHYAQDKHQPPSSLIYNGIEVEIISMGLLQNGHPKLQIRSVTTGEPQCIINVCIDERVDEGCIIVKDYSENKGMLKWLIANEIVSPPERIITHHWSTHKVEFPVCQLLIQV